MSARRPDISELAGAAQRALAAEAVLLLEQHGVAFEVLAAEGFGAGDLEPVLDAILACETDRLPSRVDVRGFRGMLDASAATDEGRVLLVALRRDRGGFENVALLDVFARHAALAVRLPRGARSTAGAPTAARILMADDVESLVSVLSEDLERLLGCARAGVFLWDEREGMLQLAPGSFGTNAETSAAIPNAVVDWASCTARVFATGHPYLCNEARTDPGVLREQVAHFGLQRMLSVALEEDGRRIGVLQLADKPTPFTLPDVQLAIEVAPMIARALQVARGRFAVRRAYRLEEILSGVAVDIACGKSLQEFLGPALDDVCDAASASAIAIVPTAGEAIVWRRESGHEELDGILLSDAHHASTLRSHVAGPRRAGATGWASLHVPIFMNDERAGTLSAVRSRGKPFGREERRSLSRLANLVALAWSTERYQRRQADLARLSERRRIAEELHDHPAQMLYAARIALESLRGSPELPQDTVAGLDRALDLVVRGDASVREIINRSSMEPISDLPHLLAEVVSGIEDEFRRPVQLEISSYAAEAATALSGPGRSLLAKAAREALVNAAKHAGPCQLRVHVSLTRRGRILLSIIDDGIGSAGRRGGDGFGLTSTRRAVRRHGGALRIHSGGTGGTRVAVSLPL